jgi:hypothetical protein
MTQNVLDGVMEIEAKAAKKVDGAKADAAALRGEVAAKIEALAKELEDEAQQEIAQHTEDVKVRKGAALAELDRQLEAVLAAIETVEAERVAPLARELVQRLEQ